MRNTFAWNITDQDQTSFIQTVNQRGGELAPLYPIVRGRLETVNDVLLVDHLGNLTAWLGQTGTQLDRIWRSWS